MNFIDDLELAARFKKNLVPSRERFYYFLILQSLASLRLTSFFLQRARADLSQWDIMIDIIGVCTAIGGLIYCYRINAKGDDKEFIERFTCISFPAGIRLVVLFVLPMGFIGFLLLSLGMDESILNVIGIAAGLGLWVYFFMRLGVLIELASG